MKNKTLSEYWHSFEILPHALGEDFADKSLKILSSATNSSLLNPNPVFIDRYKNACQMDCHERISRGDITA